VTTDKIRALLSVQSTGIDTSSASHVRSISELIVCERLSIVVVVSQKHYIAELSHVLETVLASTWGTQVQVDRLMPFVRAMADVRF
jgi:hypothetical protein